MTDMKNFRRIFLIVLDSVGIGQQPDAARFGDEGADTMKSISASKNFFPPNLLNLGLGNIDGLSYLPRAVRPTAAHARLQELSAGKDTTIGHWEIAGVVSEDPLPTYPEGFPEELLSEFSRLTGRGWLCNKPYSGTQVIKDYGREHIETGKLIVYTSADSVFQIAAHEDIVGCEKLYEYCRAARSILKGKHGVGRVIARPFVGDHPDFVRTSNRHDFSLEPPQKTLLSYVSESGRDVIAVGKISDIFSSVGVTEKITTGANDIGMEKTLEVARRDFNGLCFVNLVDFDMLYGHRRDIDGYALALAQFDAWLPKLLSRLGEDDALMITADHGCDPGFLKTTDHTREYVPLLVCGNRIKPENLGTRTGFSDIAATAADMLGVPYGGAGESFAEMIVR